MFRSFRRVCVLPQEWSPRFAGMATNRAERRDAVRLQWKPRCHGHAAKISRRPRAGQQKTQPAERIRGLGHSFSSSPAAERVAEKPATSVTICTACSRSCSRSRRRRCFHRPALCRSRSEAPSGKPALALSLDRVRHADVIRLALLNRHTAAHCHLPRARLLHRHADRAFHLPLDGIGDADVVRLRLLLRHQLADGDFCCPSSSPARKPCIALPARRWSARTLHTSPCAARARACRRSLARGRPLVRHADGVLHVVALSFFDQLAHLDRRLPRFRLVGMSPDTRTSRSPSPASSRCTRLAAARSSAPTHCRCSSDGTNRSSRRCPRTGCHT